MYVKSIVGVVLCKFVIGLRGIENIMKIKESVSYNRLFTQGIQGIQGSTAPEKTL